MALRSVGGRSSALARAGRTPACSLRSRSERQQGNKQGWALAAAEGSQSATAASSEADFSRRQALSLLAMSASATIGGSDALAAIPKGYSAIKNAQKGYAFLYPFGWQEVSVDGAEVTVKDIIEPLESLSLEILPTNKADITEYGEVAPLAETLVKQVLVPPSQEGSVLSADMRENEGIKYYTIEYTAKARTFTRHSFTVLAVQRGRLYTITTGANERRWPIMQDKLKFVAKSFTLL